MDKDLDLNKSGPLKDGSKASQSGAFGSTKADYDRGFLSVEEPNDPQFSDENDGGTTTTGNPLKRGGFAGRPLGWAR